MVEDTVACHQCGHKNQRELLFCSNCHAVMDLSVYKDWSLGQDVTWIQSLAKFLPVAIREWLAVDRGSMISRREADWFAGFRYELKHPRLSRKLRKASGVYPHWFDRPYLVLGNMVTLEALWSEKLEKPLAEELALRRAAIEKGIGETLDTMGQKAIGNLKEGLEGWMREHKSVVDWIIKLGEEPKVDDEDLRVVYAELDFLENRRDLAENLQAAYEYLGTPDVLLTTAKTMIESDTRARMVTDRIAPIVWPDWDYRIPFMPYSRTIDPPEVYWWHWNWLEKLLRKPLPILFGFNPADIDTRIVRLREF